MAELIQERIVPFDQRAAQQAQLATRNSRHFSDTTISLINPFLPMA